ncbi:caspase domain-containing protein [Hypoxylon crocopeplum]|nr:caspase domain-containing protein [Hypoxylon crocopeplum]
MTDRNSILKHYALLIGIDAYPEEGCSLHGCVRDVQEIREYLTKSGATVDIQMLTATSKDRDLSVATESSGLLPTHSNVVSSFEKITAKASSGDFVYIHFSGHGTAIEPRSEYSNSSSGDLALVLLEGIRGTDIRYLRGLELAHLLRKMVEKKLVVTLILDCCFSGGVVRVNDLVRFLPYDSAVDKEYPPLFGQSPGLEDEAILSPFRGASMRPNWLINPDGYTILAACRPSEKAKEVTVNKQKHGALSYFLLRAFIKQGRVGGRQQQIYAYLCARFRETCPKQKPMLYGNKSLWFFEESRHAIDAISIPVFKNESGLFQLEAGQAHGVCDGDQFALCTIDSAEHSSGALHDSIIAEVIHARALLSDLTVLDSSSVTAASGLTAIPRSHLSFRKFPIQLELRLPCRGVWTAALQERLWLNIQYIDDVVPHTSFSFYVAVIANDQYEIRDQSNQVIPNLPASPYDLEEDANFVLDVLEHFLRFKLVKNMANEHPAPPFRNSFDVQLINNTKGKIYSPGCSQGVPFKSSCSHSECLVEVEDGGILEILVQNKSEERTGALHVHAYTMGFCWEIENLLKGDHDVIPPRGSNKSVDFEQGSSGLWKKKIRMMVGDLPGDEEKRYCDDIFKIFLTTQQTSFMSIELPELGKIATRRRPSRSRGEGQGHLSEDWAVLTFRVRTYVR